MSEATLLQNFLLIGAILFGVGIVGFLSRRNMIVMFLSAEMMLQGVALNLVGFSRFHNDWGGQMLVIFVITVAACEAAIALALIMMLFRQSGSLDINTWQGSREEGVPLSVDRELPALDTAEPEWPVLSPSGVEPAHTAEQEEVETREAVFTTRNGHRRVGK